MHDGMATVCSLMPSRIPRIDNSCVPSIMISQILFPGSFSAAARLNALNASTAPDLRRSGLYNTAERDHHDNAHIFSPSGRRDSMGPACGT